MPKKDPERAYDENTRQKQDAWWYSRCSSLTRVRRPYEGQKVRRP